MKNFFKSLMNVLGTIGGVILTVSWAITFVNITIGLAIWSAKWCNGLLDSLF